jgi:hypothetical protein
LADNGEQTLDADIRQCMQDILRIRQSIVNSKSGQMVPEPEIDIRPAVAVAVEEKMQETPHFAEAVAAPVQQPVTIAPAPQAAEPEVLQHVADAPVIPQPVPTIAPSPEVAQAENPFAVTKEEVAALLKVEDEHLEAPLVSEGIGQVEPAVETVPPFEEVPGEAELDAIVKEAEEWMQKVAPVEMPGDLPDVEEPEVAAVAEAVAVPEKRFDEVVSNLQGEQLIEPVDDESPTARDEDDVNLQIIKGMKEESERGEEERGGVPRFDLEESSLGGTLESRRNAAATRKGPGRKRVEGREAGAQPKEEARREPEITVVEQKVQERQEVRLPLLERVQDTRRLERQRRILAQIVARDIEVLCGQGRRQRARVVWR